MSGNTDLVKIVVTNNTTVALDISPPDMNNGTVTQSFPPSIAVSGVATFQV